MTMHSYAFIESSADVTTAAPVRLVIYYGYPSLVNGASGNAARALAIFAAYDVIVLGDGLEVDGVEGGRGAGHEEHAFTARLIEGLRLAPRRPTVFGYVDLGSTQRLHLREVARRLDRWARIGAAGVLLDEAGYDFGVTRERQNAAVRAAHERGLNVCFNAFDPDDIFSAAPVPLNQFGGGNPRGLPPEVSENDALLVESFAVRNSVPEGLNQLTLRTRAALAGREQFGTHILGVATGAGLEDDAMLAQYGWWSASVLGLDAYGWGAPMFSASSSHLPWMPRPGAERVLTGATYLAEPTFRDNTWRRRTSLGTIVVNASRCRGTLDER